MTNEYVTENLGVTTESQNRLPIFQPSDKPKFVDNINFESAYGRVKISGRLGQTHKNLLETCLYLKEEYYYNPEEKYPTLKLVIDPYKVRKFLSSKGGEYSNKGILNLFEDMQNVKIHIEKTKVDGGELIGDGNLISDVFDNEEEIQYSKNKNKTRKLKVISFGVLATKLIAEELKFGYNPGPILELKSGISKAIVRFLKTQKKMPNGGYKLDTLITLVSLKKLTNSEIRKNRARFLKDREILEKNFNIIITKNLHVVCQKPLYALIEETTKNKDNNES